MPAVICKRVIRAARNLYGSAWGALFIEDLPQPRRGNDLPHDAVFVLSR